MGNSGSTLTRDQIRQRCAYEAVRGQAGKGGLSEEVFKDFKILVNDFGAHIMRSGLSATMAFIERDKSERARKHFLQTLVNAKLPHLQDVTADNLTERIRNLEVDQYMLVTRDIFALSVWLRRAVQARDAAGKTGKGEPDA